VDAEDGRREGFDQITVRVGPKAGRKVRFTGVLLGTWGNNTTAINVYRSRAGKFVIHTQRTADWSSRDADGKPGGWRSWLGSATSAGSGRPVTPRSTSWTRSKHSARSFQPSSSSWSLPRPSSRRSKTSTSSAQISWGSDDERRPDRARDPGTRTAQVYGKQLVLDGIDLDVAAGTVFALLGSNGAGKTTTVHILSTLIPPAAATSRSPATMSALSPTPSGPRSA